MSLFSCCLVSRRKKKACLKISNFEANQFNAIKFRKQSKGFHCGTPTLLKGYNVTKFNMKTILI